MSAEWITAYWMNNWVLNEVMNDWLSVEKGTELN